jgi:hypothetical protein
MAVSSAEGGRTVGAWMMRSNNDGRCTVATSSGSVRRCVERLLERGAQWIRRGIDIVMHCDQNEAAALAAQITPSVPFLARVNGRPARTCLAGSADRLRGLL